jgi:hypothetical protein
MPARNKNLKRPGKSRLRITGVVRAMNQVRKKLEAGIPASEQDEFRRYVRSVVEGIELICRQHGLKKLDLPAPTYRAYQFLTSLNLGNLPTHRQSPQTEETPRIRVYNLAATRDLLQVEFFRLAKDRQKTGTPSHSEARLFKEINDLLKTIEAEISQLPGRSQHLSAPSRRIYHWLEFLSHRGNFDAHLETLSDSIKESQSDSFRRQFINSQRGNQKEPEIFIELFNVPHMYRARQDPTTFRITLCEAFSGAPRPLIAALLASITASKKSKSFVKIKDYAHTEQFISFARALHLYDPAPSIRMQIQGQRYNLEEIFQRINQVYFHGEIALPLLTWNRTITHRKLGHYQPATDTIMLSLTLDDPRVPAFVVDFVMFHELLHKKLGAQLVNGRRYAHNPEFRKAERQFERYQEAQDFLKSLGENLQL